MKRFITWLAVTLLFTSAALGVLALNVYGFFWLSDRFVTSEAASWAVIVISFWIWEFLPVLVLAFTVGSGWLAHRYLR